MTLLLILTFITFFMTVRSVFIMAGTYKDPVLASFERYGDEHIFSPPISLFFWASCFIYVSLYWYINGSAVIVLGVAILIPLGISYSFIYDFIHKNKRFFRKYPQWYDEIIENTDREERRRIAYLWLFLPPSTRMVYNSNNTLFKQWVEQVLLTVS